MPLTTTADNPALAAITGVNPSTNLAAYASLHSAYSATGANELTGGSYARQALTWGTASGGQISLTGTYTFGPLAASVTVAFVGLWSLASGGTSTNFAGMGANGGATMYAFTSTTHTGSPADTLTAPGSSYTNGTAVVVWSGVGATTPSGLTVGTIYYVIGASGVTFQLSATSGGSAVNLGTSAGSGLIQAITIETFGGSGGSFTLTGDTLSIT